MIYPVVDKSLNKKEIIFIQNLKKFLNFKKLLYKLYLQMYKKVRCVAIEKSRSSCVHGYNSRKILFPQQLTFDTIFFSNMTHATARPWPRVTFYFWKESLWISVKWRVRKFFQSPEKWVRIQDKHVKGSSNWQTFVSSVELLKPYSHINPKISLLLFFFCQCIILQYVYFQRLLSLI